MCQLQMDLCLRRCLVTPSLFSEPMTSNSAQLSSQLPPFCSDLSQLINRGLFYLSGKQVVPIVSQCAYDEEISASMCFLFGMLHLPTQVWEGRSRYFWLRLHTAQNTTTHSSLLSCFRSFHSKGHVPLWLYPMRDCCCTHIHMADCCDLKSILQKGCGVVQIITQLLVRQSFLACDSENCVAISSLFCTFLAVLLFVNGYFLYNTFYNSSIFTVFMYTKANQGIWQKPLFWFW